MAERGPMSSSATTTCSPAHSVLLRLAPGTRPKAGWWTWLPSEELTQALSCSVGSRRPEPREGPSPGMSGKACDWQRQRESSGRGEKAEPGTPRWAPCGVSGSSSALLPHWRHGGAACSSWDPTMLTREGLQPFHSEWKAVSAWGFRGTGLPRSPQSPLGRGCGFLPMARRLLRGAPQKGGACSRSHQPSPGCLATPRGLPTTVVLLCPPASPTAQVGLCAAVDLHPLKSTSLSLEDKSLLT